MSHTVEVSHHSSTRPESVWAVMSDLDAWADWLPTVTSSRRVAEPPAAGDLTGARYRLEQPKLAPAEWTVTDWRPGGSFVWESRRPGLRSVAEHEVTPEGDGSRIVLRMTWSGLLTGLVARRYGALTRDYMQTEAAAMAGRAAVP